MPVMSKLAETGQRVSNEHTLLNKNWLSSHVSIFVSALKRASSVRCRNVRKSDRQGSVGSKC